MKNLTKTLFDAEHSLMGEVIAKSTKPWEILGQIGEWIKQNGASLTAKGFQKIDPKDNNGFHAEGEDIYIAESATIAPTATIIGPCIIGSETEVRPGAYIRGKAIIGDHVVVGNSTEIKNAVLYDNVQVPHFNYVGDSILGYKAHFGAGVIAANLRGDGQNIILKYNGEKYPTERRKIGAFVGDFAEIGCNSVLNPGTILGRQARVYPLSSVRGSVLPGEIYKSNH